MYNNVLHVHVVNKRLFMGCAFKYNVCTFNKKFKAFYSIELQTSVIRMVEKCASLKFFIYFILFYGI